MKQVAFTVGFAGLLFGLVFLCLQVLAVCQLAYRRKKFKHGVDAVNIAKEVQERAILHANNSKIDVVTTTHDVRLIWVNDELLFTAKLETLPPHDSQFWHVYELDKDGKLELLFTEADDLDNDRLARKIRIVLFNKFMDVNLPD